MIKSNFSILSHVHHRIEALEVSRQITGGVYKSVRPAGSDKEDIVIYAQDFIPRAGETARVKIEIYSAPVFSSREDAVDMVPDFKRLEYLSGLIFDGIDEVFYAGCLTWVESQRFSREGDMFCSTMEICVSLRGAL
ncbi:MAG: hypothetical protein IKT29_00045 [Flavobacteriales bacterium]|nr:hypothetical protein [Flavobacteriales bacterium]